MKLSPLLALASVAVAIDDDFAAPNSAANPLRLWYPAAGKLWNDSLPIGNGRLGGMIRGTAASEIISTNEDSFWSGRKLERVNPDAGNTLETVQKLLLQGRVPEATLEAALGLSGVPTSMREYQPGGDLQIIHQNLGSVSNYERWLDVGDGIAGVYFKAGGVTYKREYLVSEPAGVMAIRLTASKPGSLNFYIKFQRPSNSQNRFAEAAYAENGDTIYTKYSSVDIDAVFGARVKLIGGSKRQIGDNIQVIKGDEAWVFSDTETTVRHKDPKAEVENKLAAAISLTYDELRDEHISDYQKFFNRVELNLGSSSKEQKALSTDARRVALGAGGFDPELVSLYFQFGRYLLIASSRLGTYPPNLQGIWNNDMNPAWGSKYTIDINLQMNYWPAEVTNLQELTQPLFDLIETAYESGKKTAKSMYNAKGWLIHHNTDIWGDTAPQDIWPAATYWPLGGVWLLAHVYEHYLYTGDKDFLEKHYYLLYEQAEFFADFMTDYKGWKVTNPSCSPEASYKNGSISGGMTIGATMDNSLLREFFGNLLEATKILGKPKTALVTKVEDLKASLPPLQISSKTGRLMEWIEDFTESEAGHRHMSHLYGLFPGNEISQKNKTMWDAAKSALEWRVANDAGNMGWSRAWVMSLHARTFDGESVEKDINALLYNLTYNSLLDAGPPAGFQIDGNFGGTAGIAESLLQSHDGVLILLPALPPSAKVGSFSGLVARGGFQVDAFWADGLLVNATVESRLGNKLMITTGTRQLLSTEKGCHNETTIVMNTKKSSTYTFFGGRAS